jgi:hypothetical protein
MPMYPCLSPSNINDRLYICIIKEIKNKLVPNPVPPSMPEFTRINSVVLVNLFYCMKVANAPSPPNFENSTAHASSFEKNSLCLAASSKMESQYTNLCQILLTLLNIYFISVSLYCFMTNFHSKSCNYEKLS